MKYRVFTKKGCGTCKSVLAILREKQADFTEIDVATAEGLDLAQKLGVKSSGTVIDENDNIIPFDRLVKTIVENRENECASCTV